MDDHIVDKRSLRIEQRRILRLPNRQPRSVIHGNVLHGGQRLRPRQANVAHVADIENAHAGAHRHVLVDDAAADRRGILDRHVPAIEVDHLRAHLAMDGVQRGLADGGACWRESLQQKTNPNLNQRAVAGLPGWCDCLP